MRNISIKELYNLYLKTSRSKQNKPYKLRKNWEGFDESEEFPKLVKLKGIFDRNEIVNIEDFFIAPYEIYQEQSFYDLDFYNSLNAIKVYNIFCTRRNSLDPDSDLQINHILRGIKFIKNFCTLKKISLSEYLNFKEKDATVNSFVVHLKEKNISIYNLFPFTNFDRVIGKLDFQVLKFIIDDIITRISIYRSKFFASKKAKSISSIGLKIIEKEIKLA